MRQIKVKRYHYGINTKTFKLNMKVLIRSSHKNSKSKKTKSIFHHFYPSLSVSLTLCPIKQCGRRNWWHNLFVIFHITEAVLGGAVLAAAPAPPVPPAARNPSLARGKKVRLSHTALIFLHCLGNSNKHDSCPELFASILYTACRTTGNDCSFLCC